MWRRLKRWGEAGVWERIWRAALSALDQRGQLDWSMFFLDGSLAPAKNGGEKVGATKEGKGAKWMLVVDGNGLPLGFHLDSAKVAEVKLAASPGWAISVGSSSAGIVCSASTGANSLSPSCCCVCVGRLPSRPRSRWSTSREGGVRGTNVQPSWSTSGSWPRQRLKFLWG